MDQIIYIYNKLISLIIIYMGHKKKKHAKIYNKIVIKLILLFIMIQRIKQNDGLISLRAEYRLS
jgi:Flp pilus assembly protein protease CpaA